MPTKRAQMNVLVTAEAKAMARTCASAHEESLNTWVEEAIREKAAKDYEAFDLEGMTKDLRRVAKKYLPGKVATLDEMLAMARRVAADEVEEGLSVERRVAENARPHKDKTPSRKRT